MISNEDLKYFVQLNDELDNYFLKNNINYSTQSELNLINKRAQDKNIWDHIEKRADVMMGILTDKYSSLDLLAMIFAYAKLKLLSDKRS